MRQGLGLRENDTGSARSGWLIRHCFFLWHFLCVIQSRCGEESRECFFRRSTQDAKIGILRSADFALNDTKRRNPESRRALSLFSAHVFARGLRFCLSSERNYLIASAFGGEPMPPGIFSGADVRKKS